MLDILKKAVKEVNDDAGVMINLGLVLAGTSLIANAGIKATEWVVGKFSKKKNK